MSNEQKHILGLFETALSSLNSDIRRMGELAKANLANATRGLLERNVDLCNRCIADDEDVDTLEKSIDREGINIITKFSPMAKDLRRVITTMKVSTALERISDHAVGLAKRARHVLEQPAMAEIDGIQLIAELAAEQLKDAVSAFCDGNLKLALQIQSRDEALDQAYRKFHQQVIGIMEKEPTHVRNDVDLLFITRFLERIGDQSVNIAEDAVYLLTAYDIRHGGELPPVSATGLVPKV